LDARSTSGVLDKALVQLTKGVTKDQQALGSMVDILLEDAKKVLLLPFASTLEVLPRWCRISRAQGKEVEFTLRGEKLK
jgi:two-component system chemotaxis sensor kinase CheA